MGNKEDLRKKTIILTNPTVEQDEKYSEMFRKGEIGGLVCKFDKKLEMGERGFLGKVEIQNLNEK